MDLNQPPRRVLDLTGAGRRSSTCHARRRYWLSGVLGICLLAALVGRTTLSGGTSAGLPVRTQGQTASVFYVSAVVSAREARQVASGLGAPTGLTATASNSQVSLTWNAPPPSKPAVIGYDIYEGTAPGSESATPVNSSPVTSTSYTVTGLTNGSTYYFVVTAVNDLNAQSGNSNEASANPGSNGNHTATHAAGWLPLLTMLLAAAMLAAGALAIRRRRLTSRQPPAPGPSVRAVPNPGPPGLVSIHDTGTGATHTVHIEPTPGARSTTIEEVKS